MLVFLNFDILVTMCDWLMELLIDGLTDLLRCLSSWSVKLDNSD